jgi:hypothetical protein
VTFERGGQARDSDRFVRFGHGVKRRASSLDCLFVSGLRSLCQARDTVSSHGWHLFSWFGMGAMAVMAPAVAVFGSGECADDGQKVLFDGGEGLVPFLVGRGAVFPAGSRRSAADDEGAVRLDRFTLRRMVV